MKKVVTFGELMLRLAPNGHLRFLQQPSFEATFGGGEVNVAVSLANFGLLSLYVTRLPSNDIGLAAVRELRKYGVDASSISLGGDRIGIYYLEKGASQRPSKVIYDRKHSAIAEATMSDFDFEKIFTGAKWFHFTGITPALGGELPAICAEACRAAKAAGARVSCDLNYRKNLWSEEHAQKIMSGLMEYVDICIANEEDAEKVFGIKSENSDLTSGKIDRSEYIEIAEKLESAFGFKQVCITLRESISASDNNWSALLYTGRESFFSKKHPVHIVDRVGGGDSFAAGIIYSLLNGFAPKHAIEFATAAGALKHSIEGDFNLCSVREVETLAGGDGSGRVVR